MDANLAVLIDFENVAAGTEKEGLGRFDVDAVLERIKDKGRVLVARSYADWGRFARFKQGLLKANVTMYELTSHGMQDKNRADIAMVVDALELAFTRDYIDTFVVVSGDSDFTPLVLKMREMNKRIVGIGTRSSTSRLLIQACDEFIFYDSIVAAKKKSKRRSKARSEAPSSKQAAFAVLVEAVEGLLRESSEVPNGSVVKGALLRRAPDFSEGDYGFSSWSRFLKAAKDAGLINLTRNDKSGGYFVDVVDSDTHGEPDVDIAPTPEGPWVDPYVPTGMEWVIEALSKEGYNPLASATRMSVLECLESVVQDRKRRKRRNNIQFVREDVRRRVAKQHSDLPASALRSVFDALMNVHVFMHRDGTPVRTASAPFDLEKNADEMNVLLTNLYLETLKSMGADLSNTKGLADLFLGNPERERVIQESLAWLQQPSDEDLLAIDDLLEVDGEDAAPAAPAEPAKADSSDAEPAPKKAAAKKKAPAKKKTTAKKKAEPAAADDVDDLLVAEEPEEAPKKKPARKRTSKKTADAEAPAADAAPEAAEAAADEPKKKPARKRRTTKKKTEEAPPAEAASADADDALLVAEEPVEEKPKRKPRRRKAPAKKTEDTPEA